MSFSVHVLEDLASEEREQNVLAVFCGLQLFTVLVVYNSITHYSIASKRVREGERGDQSRT